MLSKFEKLFIYSFSILVRCFTKINPKRVLFWSTVGKDYSCNPRYISDYLLEHDSTFEIYWMFRDNVDISLADPRIKVVKFGTFKYLLAVNTSEYIITNHRTDFKAFFWKKRKNQKYVMTWHGSMPLKKIERDALDTLGEGYSSFAINDSLQCDVMISDSAWYTDLIRRSFWYNGEILEIGMPRNDIYYEFDKFAAIREKVVDHLSCNKDSLIVLYAPTFRTDYSVSSYISDWSSIRNAFKSKFKKDVVILLRLHPTLLGKVDTNLLLGEENVYSVSNYQDMQELICASDVLITDYSSTMFESTLSKKLCLLYTPDRDSYDRGFYFSFSELPYITCDTLSELCDAIKDVDYDAMLKQAELFMKHKFGVLVNTEASKAFYNWMLYKSSLSR